MSDIDPNQEWNQLTEVYRQMEDEELLNLASQENELTDIARDVLQGEICKRGLKLEPSKPEPMKIGTRTEGFDPAKLDLILLNRYFNRADAVWTKSVMQWAEIPIYFGPGLVEEPDKIESYQIGVDGFVLRNDQHRAISALHSPPIPPPEDDSEPEEDQAADAACCPQCKSFEIVLLNVKNGLNGEQVFRWRCDACGHKWADDGVAQYKPLPEAETEENL